MVIIALIDITIKFLKQEIIGRSFVVLFFRVVVDIEFPHVLIICGVVDSSVKLHVDVLPVTDSFLWLFFNDSDLNRFGRELRLGSALRYKHIHGDRFLLLNLFYKVNVCNARINGVVVVVCDVPVVKNQSIRGLLGHFFRSCFALFELV